MKRCQKCGQEYEDSARFCSRDGGNLEQVMDEMAETVIAPAQESADKPKDSMIGRVLAGRYRLIEKLGQGGMGAVYKGQHIKMNRLTAIKILTHDLADNPEFVTRFEREAEMASHIDNPHAVSIYDFGEAEDGLVYLAMEFLDGEPLSSVISKEGAIPLQRTVNITRQAAEALESAHKLGIIHRDFKPDNVMICQKQGREDWVEVVDFGIAKRSEVDAKHQALTHTGFVLGTPQYMSPEQVSGEELDRRSDLYSLALVVYEMLTGALPFEGGNPQSQMVKRLLEPPLPLHRVRPQLTVPNAVEQVIMKALARYPKDRYSSTVEFSREFEKASHSQSYTPTQPGQTPLYPSPPGGTQVAPQRPTYPAPQQPTYPGAPPPMTGPYPNRPPSGPAPLPGTPPPFQPPGTGYNMPPGQHPYSTYYPQQQPPKSKAGIIVLIIVLSMFFLMGSCVACLSVMDANAKTPPRKEKIEGIERQKSFSSQGSE
ncbi:MAG: protein kinase [Blastocatellia bacterium]|nr:protein kinase [Blastocatellia bacterium]